MQVPVAKAAAGGGRAPGPTKPRRHPERNLPVIEARPRHGGVEEDQIRLGLELGVVDAAGIARGLLRSRDHGRPGRSRSVQQRAESEQAHLPDGGLGVLAAECSGGEPCGGPGLAVGVVVVGGIGPAA